EAPPMGMVGEMPPNKKVIARKLPPVNPQRGARQNGEGLGPEYLDPGADFRAARAPRLPGPRLPDLGPEQYFLTFKMKPRKAGGLFVADPFLLLPEHTHLPVAPLDLMTTTRPLFIELNGSIVHTSPRGECQYRQVTRPVEDHDL